MMWSNKPGTRGPRINVHCLRHVVALLVLHALASGLCAESKPVRKPNVVLLFIDDLGYGDTGPYGCTDIPTPNLDKLADQGIRCTATYITNPPCCPSRSSLMMGQYAQRFGKYGMSRGLPIPEDRPTLAEFMRDSGYVTGFIGKWDIGSRAQVPLNCGFSEVARKVPGHGASRYMCVMRDGTKAWRTEVDGDYMVEFIERNKDKPFFLYFSPDAVHSKNTDTPAALQDRTHARGKRRLLAGNIVSVDDQVGKLLDTLDALGLREDTLVIFSSDNGPNLTEMGSAAPYVGGKGKGTQKEGWVRVPAIFSLPGRLPAGERYNGLMATFDIYATVAALAGRSIPDHCDGVDLIPFLRGEKKGDAHEYLFWLNNDPDDAKHRHLTAVRWKYWRLYRHKDADWQLFDLAVDPAETVDIARQYPEVVERLAGRHEAWAGTLAPLGKIPDVKAQPQVPEGYGWVLGGEEGSAPGGGGR